MHKRIRNGTGEKKLAALCTSSNPMCKICGCKVGLGNHTGIRKISRAITAFKCVLQKPTDQILINFYNCKKCSQFSRSMELFILGLSRQQYPALPYFKVLLDKCFHRIFHGNNLNQCDFCSPQLQSPHLVLHPF